MKNTTPIAGRTWSAEEAAEFLGCTKGTLQVWCSMRKVPFVKVGRLTRFRKRDLDAWLDSRAVLAEA